MAISPSFINSFSLSKSHVMQFTKTVRFVCFRISGMASRNSLLQNPITGSPGSRAVQSSAAWMTTPSRSSST